MARYTPEHKQATRRRMIDTASRRFKTDGLDGSGIAALVGDAGLTNGAFYGHFPSKDALITEVVADQLARQAEQLEQMPPGAPSLAAFVADYLSPAHRDDRAGGCPSAALLDEIGRADPGIREAYTTGARRLVAAVAGHLVADGVPAEEAGSRAIGILALLVGALQSARALSDPELSDQVLATARRHATAIATASPAPAPTTTPTEQEPR